MTKEQFIDWAKGRGWQEDKWGHLHKNWNDRDYRFKISSISIRHEIKVKHNSGSSEWMRLGSGYLEDLGLTSEGRLTGLS